MPPPPTPCAASAEADAAALPTPGPRAASSPGLRGGGSLARSDDRVGVSPPVARPPASTPGLRPARPGSAAPANPADAAPRTRTMASTQLLLELSRRFRLQQPRPDPAPRSPQAQARPEGSRARGTPGLSRRRHCPSGAARPRPHGKFPAPAALLLSGTPAQEKAVPKGLPVSAHP
ncbi:atherin-like [Artibeus jamaicensis]|uniref:atherin-like n=1 Tax=Artibeus jamaicensis TaxID=9417 RepID=UPI00235A4796|nr:atherin-like [Artibeus jamaicensis]